jgi:hypothetical protein
VIIESGSPGGKALREPVHSHSDCWRSSCKPFMIKDRTLPRSLEASSQPHPKRSPGPGSALPTYRPPRPRRPASAPDRHLHNQDHDTCEIAPDSSCLLRHGEAGAVSLTNSVPPPLDSDAATKMINTTARFIFAEGEQGWISVPYLPRSGCTRQAGSGEPDLAKLLGRPDLRVGAGGVSVRPRGQLVFNRQRTDTKMTIAAERLAVIAAIISLSSVMA